MSAILKDNPNTSEGINFRCWPVKGISPDKWIDKPDAGSEKTLPVRYSEVRALMNDLENEHGNANWDGEGAAAMDRESYNLAFFFLLYYLPEEISLPNVWCDPSGRVNAEWFSKDASVGIAFKAEREFLIAGYNPLRKEVFEKTNSPTKTVELLNNILYS